MSEEQIDKHREAAILYLIERKGTWVKSKELAAASGYSTKATCVELRASMRHANFLGAPIITAAKGFMWATQPNQLKRYAERLEGRMEEIRARVEAVRRAQAKMEAVWNESQLLQR